MLPYIFGVSVAVEKVMAFDRAEKSMVDKLYPVAKDNVADVFKLLLSMTAVSCGNGKFVDDTAPPLDVAHSEAPQFADVVPTKYTVFATGNVIPLLFAPSPSRVPVKGDAAPAPTISVKSTSVSETAAAVKVT